jgi:hypothetical protein
MYLELPPVGGELLIWPLGFAPGLKGRWDFYRHAHTLAKLTTPDEAGQATLRKRLADALQAAAASEAGAEEAATAAAAASRAPAGPLRVRPQPGDLVIICTQVQVKSPLAYNVP